jgi:hypothetical protein
MKITMQLTLDGLIRALRWRVLERTEEPATAAGKAGKDAETRKADGP